MGITIVYLLYKHGCTRRVLKFIDQGIEHEVREYINFRNNLLNYRYITASKKLDTTSCESVIYTNNPSTWAYFDIVRTIIHEKNLTPHRILILGGGGGSFIHTFLQSYASIHIDAVEISKKMIGVTNQYVLEKRDKDNITWIHQNAFQYIKNLFPTQPKYDCIIVDLFKHGFMSGKEEYEPLFIRSLQSLLYKNGFLFINFGYNSIRFNHLLTAYKKEIHPFNVYLYHTSIIAHLYHNNIIGVNCKLKNTMHHVIPLQ